MNILLLSEINPMLSNGGGFTIMQDVVKHAIERGHEVIVKTPTDDQNAVKQNITNSDLTISWDIFNEPNKRPRTWFPPETLTHLVNDGNYVAASCGYSDVCPVDYLPCSGTAKLFCPECFKNNGLVRQYWKRAKAAVYLSPLQAKISLDILGIDREPYIMVPTVDHKEFYPMGLERIWDYAYVGWICEAKGYLTICKYIEDNNLQDKKIAWVGGSLVGKMKYGEHIGKLDRSELPVFLNQVDNFFALTRWPEPYGLSIKEAQLCNCNIISNGNSGWASCEDAGLNCSNGYGKFLGFLEEIN